MRRCPFLAFCLGILATVAGADVPEPRDLFGEVAAAYLVKVDGREVWARNPDRPLPPGSLTKMMTALLVLERADLGQVATVSREASRETGTRLGLAPGDRMSVIELLGATLLDSANDACHALADHVAGSEKRFVSLMNARAREMGLSNTRFANACGHDDPGLYSTARDLARLAETAMGNPVFAKMSGLVEGEISTADGGKTFLLENRNLLIGSYPGAKGVKTGFTGRAGKCLAAFAERDGKRVLLVLLNAPDRWWKAGPILDAAFDHGSGASAGTP
ncbi:MAG: Serine-type D-Ala-D-Ala carboxypeptidase [Deltaproteobacteria bacterium]|nr:Serine-type D-Ala-D-Ala carboxypeptidase [Deltaproteobacteria bacterium]MBP2682371.1 Serine-type D-Ala-D-Ala carboxypeptidase [Deltaproteobacteria bacterium]MBP2686712.1 Serine-type D-Ala-D-Ala carboxypeptidase [Deltaproteobacteria bacterium]MBP2688176.1 Serine-type D-Ala-D-Ala carboxypeptidase [Deltaproteobacteria bacterium]